MPTAKELRVNARDTAMPPNTKGVASSRMALSQITPKVTNFTFTSGDASCRTKQAAMESANAVDILDRKEQTFLGFTLSSLK